VSDFEIIAIAGFIALFNGFIFAVIIILADKQSKDKE